MPINDYEVLPECPARTHNTRHVAQPYARNGDPPPIRCICPHSDEIREQAAERLRAAAGVRGEEMRVKALTDWERKARLPFNYTGGLCTTPAGRKIADLGFRSMISERGIAARQVAKDQCNACPLRAACLANVIAEEGDKPGSLEGIYGGLDPYERQGRRLVMINGSVVEVPMEREGAMA